MRFFILFLVAVVAIIGLSFFRPPNIDENNRLIISVYAADESITDSSEINSKTPFSFQRLEVGKPLITTPSSGFGDLDLYNINLYFEYDGIINVTAEEMQLSINKGATPFYKTPEGHKDRTFTNKPNQSMHINYSGYMGLVPVGSSGGYVELCDLMGLPARHTREIGHEYYVYVDAYGDQLSDTPTATAILKFVKLPDRNKEVMGFTIYSRFFSIELVSLK